MRKFYLMLALAFVAPWCSPPVAAPCLPRRLPQPAAKKLPPLSPGGGSCSGRRGGARCQRRPHSDSLVRRSWHRHRSGQQEIQQAVVDEFNASQDEIELVLEVVP